MPDILNVLRRIHCPRLILELMLLIYRFIFVLFEISSAIRTAQNSRLGNRDYRTSMKSLQRPWFSALFIRAMKKSNALYDAMESRCYDGTIHVLDETFPPRKREICWILFFEAALYLCVARRKRSFSKDRRTVLRGAFMEDIILKADDLYFSYEGEKSHSLNGLSLEIGRGKKIAFMGANGSGKSTFFLCCNGILKPSKGTLYLDGKPYDYSRQGLLKLRQRVGIVFQDPE